MHSIDTSTIENRESQFRSSHRYAWESGEHFVGQLKSPMIVCGEQNQVKSWTSLSSCRGSRSVYISAKGQAAAALLMDSTMNSKLWSALFLLYVSVISTSTLLRWALNYVSNLEQLHFGPPLHVILVTLLFPSVVCQDMLHSGVQLYIIQPICTK